MEIGQEAPDFELRDQHGQRVRLSAFRGEVAVVLVFYPFAFSGVCSAELAQIRDEWPRSDSDVQLIAISCDPMFALRAFSDRDALEFPLLSDFWPHGEVSRAYGVFDEQRGCPTRSTFILDRDGRVRWSVHNALSQARDLAEYRKVLAELSAEAAAE